MSRRVEKLIEEEDAEILRMLHNDEAVYVHAYYTVKGGKRVFDKKAMREEFEENMETLISLTEQKERSPFWASEKENPKEKPSTWAELYEDNPEGVREMRWPEEFDGKH